MRRCILPFLFTTCAFGQAGVTSHSFAAHAHINHPADGAIEITADSPRPLSQALTAVRREFGWTVDYEDPVYDNSGPQSYLTSDGKLTGGHFTISVKKPTDSSLQAEKTFLADLVRQRNQELGGHQFKLLQSGAGRFDIVPDEKAVENPLDVKIAISATNEPIVQIIDSILAAVTNRTGVPIIRGGLIDPDLEQTRASLSASTPQSARTLLDQVLSSTWSQMSWLMAYEPSDRRFYIGFQPTVKTAQGMNGKQTESFVLNGPNKS